MLSSIYVIHTPCISCPGLVSSAVAATCNAGSSLLGGVSTLNATDNPNKIKLTTIGTISFTFKFLNLGDIMIYFFIYLALISLIAVILTVSDKRRARKHKYRIRESVLLLFSALGGSLAMFITMLLIRHKTNHMKFMLGIPLIIVIQLAVFFVIWGFIHG